MPTKTAFIYYEILFTFQKTVFCVNTFSLRCSMILQKSFIISVLICYSSIIFSVFKLKKAAEHFFASCDWLQFQRTIQKLFPLQKLIDQGCIQCIKVYALKSEPFLRCVTLYKQGFISNFYFKKSLSKMYHGFQKMWSNDINRKHYKWRSINNWSKWGSKLDWLKNNHVTTTQTGVIMLNE